jgi:hypothetical protein
LELLASSVIIPSSGIYKNCEPVVLRDAPRELEGWILILISIIPIPSRRNVPQRLILDKYDPIGM